MTIDKGLKLTAIAALSVISLSVAYYLVIFLPQKEANRIKQQEQQELSERLRVQAEQETQEKKKGELALCLSEADANYSASWRRECDSLGLLSTDCQRLNDMTVDEYLKEKNVAESDSEARVSAMIEFHKKRADCSCKLPTLNAQRVDEFREKDRAECFKQYPQ